MSSAERGVGLHATAVVFGEWGVIILGTSGSGKSALALALLARARDSGRYGALIGDDRVWLRTQHGRLIARGAGHMAGLIEQRPTGIVKAPFEPAAVIRLAVELRDSQLLPRLPERPDLWTAQGIAAPRLALDRGRSAAENALAVDARLGSLALAGRLTMNFA